jgi:hypothetical protein
MMPGTPSNPRDALRVMRIIAVALAGGVTTFAAIVWFMHLQGLPGGGKGDALLYLWIAVATSVVAVSMILWRGRVVPILEAPATEEWRQRAADIQTGLVITLALIEAAALFGVVVYFLAGFALAGGVGVAMMWAAVALTWPQEEWLATARRTP